MPRPKIFTIGQSEAGLDASMISALVVNGNVYNATSNFQSVSGGNNGAATFFNTLASNVNCLLYSVRVTVDTNSIRAVGATLAADSAFTAATIINKGRLAVIPTSGVSVKATANAGAAPAGANIFDCCILQIGYPLPYYDTDIGNTYLTPGTGVIFHLVHPSAGAFGYSITFEWAEWSNA